MYLTVYTNPKHKQYTFDDLLNDPFMRFENIQNTPQKKVTVEIDEEYGRRLYVQRYLGLNLPDMTWTDEINPNESYDHWKIPKASGGYRDIYGPHENLKAAQDIYKNFIEKTLSVQNHKSAHAYTHKRSITTNAEAHLKNKSMWFLHLDFSKFFDSINEEFLRRMLLQVYPYKFIPEEHFERIIRLALYKGFTPQGSVLSPTLTNNIMVPIDHEICEKLNNYNKHHYVYTRYADDIFISCKQKFNPNEISNIVQEILDKWKVPFHFKRDKTKFMSVNGFCRLCGININYNKPKDRLQMSAGHRDNDKFRAMINNFCTTGEEWNISDVQKMLGKISYYKTFEKDFVERTISKYNDKYGIDIKAKAKMLINGVNYTAPMQTLEKIVEDNYEIPF